MKRLFLGLTMGIWAISAPVWGQIVPDETLRNERSQVAPLDEQGFPVDLIQGGAKRGSNLFHSFLQFNVAEGRGVYFDRLADTQNILARVTGREPSQILGTLGVIPLIGDATKTNLFLINPNGMVFGTNASLDLPGSFVATTANAIQLGNTGLFSASTPEKSDLLEVSPSALLFNSIQPLAQIVNRSQADYSTESLNPSTLVLAFPVGDLERVRFRNSFDSLNFLLLSPGLQVGDNQTIALIGGNLTLESSNLSAIDGNIELASITSPGSVSIQPSTDGFSFSYQQVPQLGKIQLLDSNLVTSGKVGGRINLRAGQIQSSSSTNSNYIAADTYASGNGDGISIDAPTINLQDTLISVNALQNQGGDIKLNASQSINLTNTNLRTRAYITGNSGNIEISTQQLFMDQSELTASAQLRSRGNAGNIKVAASNSIQLKNSGMIAAVAGIGNAGNLIVETGKLILEEGGTLSIQALTREGKPGNLEVNATESIDVIGITESGRRSSITSEGLSLVEQPTGSIRIQTRRLTVKDGGAISVSAVPGGKNRGGDLIITATDSIKISGVSKVPTFSLEPGSSSIITATATDTPAGNIVLQTGELSISNGAEIRLNSAGVGNAGDLRINANNIQMNQGRIVATSESGRGGNLQIGVNKLLLLRQASQISTTAGNNQTDGDGGNISIAAKFVVAIPKENSDITANAFRGEGGRVTLNAESGILGLRFRSQESLLSDITASSELGATGIVTLNTPSTESIQSNLNPLSQNPIDTNTLLANSCIVRNQQNGSFYIIGTGGLPINPGEISTYATGTVQPTWKLGDAIVEPQGVYQLSNGQLVMSRECDR